MCLESPGLKQEATRVGFRSLLRCSSVSARAVKVLACDADDLFGIGLDAEGRCCVMLEV